MESQEMAGGTSSFKYISKTDGRAPTGFRPSRLDPLIRGGATFAKPHNREEILGNFFEEELMAKSDGTKIPGRELRGDALIRSPTGTLP